MSTRLIGNGCFETCTRKEFTLHGFDRLHNSAREKEVRIANNNSLVAEGLENVNVLITPIGKWGLVSIGFGKSNVSGCQSLTMLR